MRFARLRPMKVLVAQKITDETRPVHDLRVGR